MCKNAPCHRLSNIQARNILKNKASQAGVCVRAGCRL